MVIRHIFPQATGLFPCQAREASAVALGGDRVPPLSLLSREMGPEEDWLAFRKCKTAGWYFHGQSVPGPAGGRVGRRRSWMSWFWWNDISLPGEGPAGVPFLLPVQFR